jgi:L-fuconolactonase
MNIDSHQHFWKYHPVKDAWITDEMHAIQKDFLPEDLLPLLKQHAIAGCVAVQADQSESETNFLLSLAEKHDFVRGVVGWIDFKADNLEQRLEYFSQFQRLKGFRHVVQGEPKGFLSDPEFIKGVKQLKKFGFTYDLLIYHHQLEEALYFANKVSEVNIVVDHIAKPSIKTGEKTHWELYLAALATFQNVYCKISGMVTEADWRKWKPEDFDPYLDEVFEAFGPNRIMYGSDWPVCLLAAKYEDQFSIIMNYLTRLSSAEKKLVLGENAKRFYNL